MIWTSLIAQGKRRLWMSLFVAILIALVYIHFARFYQGRASGWILAAAGIPVLLNVLRAALGLGYRLDRHPFRDFDLGLLSDQIAPGRPLDVELVLEARRPGTLTRLDLELSAIRQKHAERGREKAVLHRYVKPVERELALEPGVRKSYRVSLDLPANAPYSFRSMEGKLVWVVAVDAEVAGWGTLRDEIEVTVGPD
jgi:SpoOM protein